MSIIDLASRLINAARPEHEMIETDAKSIHKYPLHQDNIDCHEQFQLIELCLLVVFYVHNGR